MMNSKGLKGNTAFNITSSSMSSSGQSEASEFQLYKLLFNRTNEGTVSVKFVWLSQAYKYFTNYRLSKLSFALLALENHLTQANKRNSIH